MADSGSLTTSVLASAVASATAAATSGADDAQPTCEASNEYNGELGLRVSSIFIILVGSMLGALFPVWARRNKGVRIPNWAFFIAKYFGSGVIVATAFIHLLAPASEALTDPCLTGPITDYDWAEGIALMSVFVLFFLELLAMRYSIFDPTGQSNHQGHGHAHPVQAAVLNTDDTEVRAKSSTSPTDEARPSLHAPGVDHLGHSRSHTDEDSLEGGLDKPGTIENYSAQMTAIFILEFGVIFHSIFVGLTLAVSGPEFHTLYVVLVFHQTFEGLGLGARLANAPWPKSHRWTPYFLGAGYALSTPVAIAVGLGVRESYEPGSQTSLVANGVFDAISAGILIYTGLVELMAHEFMFSETMRRASMRTMLSAFGTMCLGAGLMALLGKWA